MKMAQASRRAIRRRRLPGSLSGARVCLVYFIPEQDKLDKPKKPDKPDPRHAPKNVCRTWPSFFERFDQLRVVEGAEPGVKV